VPIDRTSKFAFAQLHQVANVKTAAGFLKAPVEAVPYQIHTVLTDNASSSATPSSTAQDREPQTLAASHPMRQSARHGPQSQTDSYAIQASSQRD
jgi:hypothetical protein